MHKVSFAGFWWCSIIAHSILFIFILLSVTSYADDQIIVDAAINGKAVHLLYDTGAQYSTIFRSTAEHLGLKIIHNEAEVVRPGYAKADFTEEYFLKVSGNSQRIKFAVIDIPMSIPDVDGIISWNDFPNDGTKMTLIDAEKHSVTTIPIPNNIEAWKKWKIVTGSPLLMFQCGDGEKIGVDTGTEDGVFLNAQKWKQWRDQRRNVPATISADWSPSEGLVVTDIFRAKKISFGDFTSFDVPVTVSSLPFDTDVFRGFDAILGLFVLHQMKALIDYKHGFFYTLPVTGKTMEYKYNKLGAVFVPKEPDKGNDLIAHVSTTGPAYQAGIRDDDVLVKVDDLDVTKWRTDSTVRPSRFWSKPAGTKIHLFLERGGQPYDVVVTLKELEAVD